MECIKFTSVKLIIHFVTLACFVFLLSVENSIGSQKYVIQIAATKTPLNISDFAKEYRITDSIYVVKSELWNRYSIGYFDSEVLASAYTKELIKNTKLSKAFVRIIGDLPALEELPYKEDTNLVLSQSSDSTLKVDSILRILEIDNSNTTSNLISESGHSENDFSENFILNLFMNRKEIAAIKNKLIDYGNDNISLTARGFYLNIIDKIFQYSAVLIFIVIIAFYIINIISLFLILNYTIKNKNRKEKFLRIFSKMYEEVLMSYMFGDTDWDTTCIKLKRKEKKENRKILISVLLNFKDNFKGEMERIIPEIYVTLGLHKDSLKSANSSKSHKKVKGIIELTHLYPQGAKEIIPGLINHPNDYVRSEAQTSFIRLNPEEPFKFFKTLSRPFSRWTQLSAFHLIRQYQLPIPSFANYLDNKHTNIRNFSLRMIVYFQQLENISEIIRMMESEMEQTRFLSYKAVNDLRIYEGKELMKTKYWNESVKNKLEIVKAFRNIGIADDFEFLEKIIKSETISLKTEACRSMYFMHNEGKDKLLNMKDGSVPEIEKLIAHVTDSRN